MARGLQLRAGHVNGDAEIRSEKCTDRVRARPRIDAGGRLWGGCSDLTRFNRDGRVRTLFRRSQFARRTTEQCAIAAARSPVALRQLARPCSLRAGSNRTGKSACPILRRRDRRGPRDFGFSFARRNAMRKRREENSVEPRVKRRYRRPSARTPIPPLSLSLSAASAPLRFKFQRDPAPLPVRVDTIIWRRALVSATRAGCAFRFWWRSPGSTCCRSDADFRASTGDTRRSR